MYPDDTDLQPLGHLLSRICRLTHARMYTLASKIGLHRGQSMALKTLWRQNGLTHSELAGMLCIRPATMTNMITRMEKDGLVERRPDENDQRVSRVFLTGAGHAIQEQVQQIWLDFEEQVFQGLDAQERAALRRAFAKIEANLQRSNQKEQL